MCSPFLPLFLQTCFVFPTSAISISHSCLYFLFFLHSLYFFPPHTDIRTSILKYPSCCSFPPPPSFYYFIIRPGFWLCSPPLFDLFIAVSLLLSSIPFTGILVLCFPLLQNSISAADAPCNVHPPASMQEGRRYFRRTEMRCFSQGARCCQAAPPNPQQLTTSSVHGGTGAGHLQEELRKMER